VQFQRDAQAGLQDANNIRDIGRHRYWGEIPGTGIFEPAPVPTPRPDYEGLQQGNIGGYGTPLDGYQPLGSIGDYGMPLSTDQYSFTGGPNYTAPGGTGFQPIGDAGQPAIFTGMPLNPNDYGLQPSSILPGINTSSSTGTDGWSSSLGGNTNASSGIDGIQPVTVNLGWGSPGFSSGYDPGSTYGAYGSAF
jgi:hypothetical protein